MADEKALKAAKERLRKALANHDPEEAKRVTASLPEAVPFSDMSEDEVVVVSGPSKAKGKAS